MRVAWDNTLQVGAVLHPFTYIKALNELNTKNITMDISLTEELFEIASVPEKKSRSKITTEQSGTFSPNMKLPIHRWFRYSAGFSANWAKEVIIHYDAKTVLDPFVGSGTVCIESDMLGIKSYGVESHPFVYRLARGKVSWAANIDNFKQAIANVEEYAAKSNTKSGYNIPALLAKCYTTDTLIELFKLRTAYLELAPTMSDDIRSLVFLAINAILRPSSHVGTAQWQYVLPNKRKVNVSTPAAALTAQALIMAADMHQMQLQNTNSRAMLIQGDARILEGVPDGVIDLVVTSPPYANNYDYADATRLEMTFWGEVDSWGDLHEAARKYLICSSSQHSAKEHFDLDTLLEKPVIEPIRKELTTVCRELDLVRGTKGGNKTYHTMIAAYFADMGETFYALRRVTKRDSNVCFVIGDSAPYGVHAPVEKWFGELALAAGFKIWSFDKIRDRNVKWKNRKHTVPLHEGRLWIKG